MKYKTIFISVFVIVLVLSACSFSKNNNQSEISDKKPKQVVQCLNDQDCYKKALDTQDSSICNLVKDAKTQKNCLWEIKKSKLLNNLDLDATWKIIDKVQQEEMQLAILEKISDCSKFKLEKSRNLCKDYQLFKNSKNEADCDKIKKKSWRLECLASYADTQAQYDLLDLDNDGLTNAEERKYGTNPKKADTDGDGYLDGEEVKNHYDPLKK